MDIAIKRRTMKNPKAKRLSKKEWREIKRMIDKDEDTITAIAKKYKVSRTNIYQYFWRHGWMTKEKDQGTVKKFLKRWKK